MEKIFASDPDEDLPAPELILISEEIGAFLQTKRGDNTKFGNSRFSNVSLKRLYRSPQDGTCR